jgi:hypothetical protein
MDGIWDEGEPALDGVIVTLKKWCNEHQVYEEVQRTSPLGNDGKYVFTGVTPGDYKIGEVFPASFPYGKTADWFCTNPNSLTFSIGHILRPQVNPGIAGPDIGNMRYAKVRGYMFEDSYGAGGAWPDGKYDQATETGFVGEGFKVRLEGWTSGAVPVWVQRTVRTWAPITNPVMGAGNYRICELVPGTYTVTVWQGPEGDYFTTTPVSYKIVIPAYYGGSTPVLYEDLNFGYVRTSMDPILPFTLLPGWNLWSTPMVLTPSMTARDLLQTIGPQATIIMKIDKTTGNYTSYKLNFPVSKNFPIVLGEGYYIWAQQEVSFKLKGEFSSTGSTTLLAGWNMIGHSQLKPIQASELLSRANACGLNARIIMYLDASTGTYHSYKTNFPSSMNFWLEPGSAYYLWVDTPGQLLNP